MKLTLIARAVGLRRSLALFGGARGSCPGRGSEPLVGGTGTATNFACVRGAGGRVPAPV